MKKRLFALVACALILVCGVSARVDGRIIISTSPIYDYMDTLYSLSSMSQPATNRPWSEAEARQILSKLDRSSLGQFGQSLYDEALGIIDEGSKWQINDDFGLSADADFTYELYAHSNGDDFNLETDWIRSYSDRKPLIHFSFDFSASDFFYTTFDASYQMGRAAHRDSFEGYLGSPLASSDGYVGSYKLTSSSHFVSNSYFFSSPLMSNFFTDTYDFSFIWPKRAIFSFGGKNWNFSLSRDKLKIGDAYLGNLLVDDVTDYNDFSRLSIFVDDFRYDWILMFFNTWTSSGENKADDINGNRMMMIHTLEFRLWDRATLKVSENVMYRYDTLDLQFMNPAFIYHNLNNRSMFNAIAYIEANVAVFKGFQLYGQYVMDQARALHEGTEQSDSSGFVAGAQYTSELGKGYLESNAEFVYTTPLLYRRDKLDFIKVSRYYHLDEFDTSSYEGHIPFFEFIGFQFGGDTIALKIGADYTRPSVFGTSLYVLLMEHGQMNLYKSHSQSLSNEGEADYNGKTPSGDVITRAIAASFSFDASLDKAFKWPGVSAGFELDWIGRFKYTKATGAYSDPEMDVQFSLSMTVAL
jgi:hypothetical protein